MNGCKMKMLTDIEISNPRKGFDNLVARALKYESRDAKKKKKQKNHDDDSSSESFEESSDTSNKLELNSKERKLKSKSKDL